MMKVGFISLGCSKNLVVTEEIIGLFKKRNYQIVGDPAEAEILLINTCGFIESAKEEGIQTILEMADYKEDKCKYLIVTGCLVERYEEELRKEKSGLSKEKTQIKNYFAKWEREKEKIKARLNKEIDKVQSKIDEKKTLITQYEAEMEENNYMQEPTPKRKLRWGRLLIIVVVLSALIASLFWGSVWVYKNIINPPTRVVVEMEPTDGQATSNKVVDEELGERINILLLGVDDGDSDAEADEPKRTDAILVLSVDPENEKVSVLSIPRDTKVVLPGHRDPSKINAAFAYGGAVMTKQTVQSLLQIPVHYYALANWRGFIEVVDLIGGVQLYVEKDMKYHDPYADLYIDIKQGYQHMNGETAGKYVRFRSDELGDIGRVQRQQKFLKAAAAQLFSFGNITKIGQIMDTIEKYIDTDLNTVTMIKAANSFKIFGEDKIKTCVLYGQFDEDDGISYWATNRDYVNKALDELEIPYKGKRKVKEEAKY